MSPRAAPATLMVRSQVEPAGTALCLSSTAIWVRTSPRPCAPAERPGHTAREGSTLIHPTHIDTAELQTRVNALSLEQKVRLLTGADFWPLYPKPAAGLRRLVLSDGPAPGCAASGGTSGRPRPTCLHRLLWPRAGTTEPCRPLVLRSAGSEMRSSRMRVLSRGSPTTTRGSTLKRRNQCPGQEV